MRKWSLATAAVTVLAIAACKGNDRQAATNDDLSKDLAAAASSDGLTMAPALHNVQTVVSAQELSPQARVHRAPSARATRSVPHRAPHRDRVTPQVATQTASVSDPAPTTTTDVAAAAPEPSASSDNGATDPTPRPQPVDVPASGSGGNSGDGNGGTGNGRHGGGVSIGGIIGAIGGILGGVVIRGGVVDGDHCDPRGGAYPLPIPRGGGRTYPTYPSSGGRPRPGGGFPLTSNSRAPVLRGGI